MEIKSKEIKFVDIDSIIPNPRNANNHSQKQIEMLSKIIKHNGFRVPLIVSNQSGFLIAGHGRLEAAKLLEMQEVPVMFQDFKNDADEFRAMIADNKIAELAEHDDLKMIEGIKELELEELDFELLGLVDFKLPEIEDNNIDEDHLPSGLSIEGMQKVYFLLSNEQKDFLEEALVKVREEEDCSDELNPDERGNALAMILKRFIHG